MDILIQHATLILPDGLRRADLRVSGGKIAAIGAGLPSNGATVMDATGRLVFPGFIDTHTHFDMDTGAAHTADDFSGGTRAALVGGTTTVLDFATQTRGGSLRAALDEWHAKARGRAACHYGFHMAITDWNDRVRAELPEMVAAGVTSFKLYMAYDALRVDDADALAVVRAVGQLGGIVGMHCEVGELVSEGVARQRAAGNLSPAGHPLSRPNGVEALAVARWLDIGRQAGHPVNIVHLSAREGLDAVRAARARGQRVYVETCPQYLTLTEAQYHLPGFESAKFVLSPPLRGAEDRAALRAALAGGEIDTVGTDHCAFDYSGPKQLGRDDFSCIPNGIPGVEHRAALLSSLGIDAQTMARVLCQGPARLFGLYPRKGVLAVGADADLVIWNPEVKWTITAAHQTQAVDYTPYEGMTGTGMAETVLLGGEVAARNGSVAADGLGRYIARGAPDFWR